MQTKTEREALDLAEARELALIDWINGDIPQQFVDRGYDLQTFIDRAMYTRYAIMVGTGWVSFAVPEWQAFEDMLRMDGIEDYTMTLYDEHFQYEIVRVWFEGAKRCYRELGHGSEISVLLAPAGTLMDDAS